MIKHSNFARRWQEVKDDIIVGLNQIHSNEQVVNGVFTKEVEEKLKQVSKRKYAVLCRSGSEAITMSLIAHGIKPADRVVVPNYSCVAVLSSVMVAGCTPVFCEVNQYGSLDADQLQIFTDMDIKAVLASGLYGDVHDHSKIRTFCDQNNVLYINDAAQSQFALHNGVNSLKLGDTVCMSFADNKPIPVAGTFGAMLTDDDAVYHRMRHLRKNGKATREEQFTMPGYSSHPDEQFAVSILASWKHFEKWQRRRIEIGAVYDDAFAGKVNTRPSPTYSTWNGHKYAILVEDKFKTHNDLLAQGIQTEKHYVDNFSTLDFTPRYDKDFAMSDLFVQQSLTLPNNPHMTDQEIEKVIDQVLFSCT